MKEFKPMKLICYPSLEPIFDWNMCVLAFPILFQAGMETGLVNELKSKEKRKPSEGLDRPRFPTPEVCFS